MLVLGFFFLSPLALCARDIKVDYRDKDVDCEVGDRVCFAFFADADMKEGDNTVLEPAIPYVRPARDGVVYVFVAREPADLYFRLCCQQGCNRWRVHIRR
jgi:hypothetical protein